MAPAEIIAAFRAAPDIAGFLKTCDVDALRQLTRAYRSSHGLQESNGRTMYPKHTLVRSLREAEEDRRERVAHTSSREYTAE